MLFFTKDFFMIEKQNFNGREVWIKVDPYRVERRNRNIIPTEYFTAGYYFSEPSSNSRVGETIKDDDGEVRLFESPVEALSFARKQLEKRF